MGYQNAKTGNAYAGIILYKHNSSDTISNYNEYLETNLNSTLVNGHSYYFEMYYSLANSSGYGVNSLGIYLTVNQFTTSLGQYNNNILLPIKLDTAVFITDTLSWIKLSGNFLANGGENFITIGNFKDGMETKAISLNNNFIGPCGPFVSDVCYIYIDDIALYDYTDVGIQNYENDHTVSLYPNPANTEVYISAKGYEQLSLRIYNIMGELVLEKDMANKQPLDVRSLSTGSYIYRIDTNGDILKTGKLMISR